MLVKEYFVCYLCDITQPQIMKKDEKISGKITELVQKEYENEDMRGKKCESGRSVAFNGYGNGGRNCSSSGCRGSWYGRNYR